MGFSKQGKKAGWPRSSNCVQNAFFRLSPSERNETAPLGSISLCRFHTTILSGLFQAGQKAGLTNIVQLRSKRVFSTFPIGAKRKNTLRIEFLKVGFIPSFWVGFSKQCKKSGWRTSSNYVQNAFFRLSPSGRNEKTPLGSNSTRLVSYHHFEWAFPSRAKRRVDQGPPIAFKTRFFDFPHRGETKQHPWDRFHYVGFIPPFWVGFSKQGKKPGWRTSSNCVQNSFFRLSPSGRNEKTPLGSNSTRLVWYHHFEWAFPSRAKSRVDERRPIAFKTRFFHFPHRGKTKKHPWDRIPLGRFHTTILSGLFQAGQKGKLTNVVQLRSKRVFSTFPIGAKRNNTLGIDSSRSVSYHHFEWAFPSRAKSRVDERSPIAFKTRFFDFPLRGETKKHPWDRIPLGWFHTTILSGLFQARQKAGLTNVIQLRSKRVFSTFPIGAKRNNTLGIDSSRSVSYHHFEWAFPSRAKRRVDERRPIAFKTRFFDFPHRGETKQHPWDRFH